MKKLLFTLLFAALTTSTAWAVPYALDFDADGTGGVYDYETIYGWDLEGVAVESLVGGDFGGSGLPVDMVTHQSLGADGILNDGDTFSENLVVQVLNGLTAPPTYGAVPGNGEWSTAANWDLIPALYADFDLFGDISGYDNGGDGDTTLATVANIANDSYQANFLSGSGTMFADLNGNEIEDAGETIATFTLISGDTFQLEETVFSGGSSQITLAFTFESVDPDYFATAPGFADLLSLIDQEWLITLAQGSIAVADGELGIDPVTGEILIGFQETGIDAKFNVVPEPGTYLLLGIGIAGLALSRRRKS